MLIDYNETISKSQFQDLMKSKENLVVAFYTSWCSPCIQTKQVLGFLSSSEIYGSIGFCSINLVKSRWLNEQFSIHSAPVVFFVKNSKLVHRVNGNVKKSDMVKNLKKYLC